MEHGTTPHYWRKRACGGGPPAWRAHEFEPQLHRLQYRGSAHSYESYSPQIQGWFQMLKLVRTSVFVVSYFHALFARTPFKRLDWTKDWYICQKSKLLLASSNKFQMKFDRFWSYICVTWWYNWSILTHINKKVCQHCFSVIVYSQHTFTFKLTFIFWHFSVYMQSVE